MLPKIHERFEQPENPNLLKIVVLGTPNAGKSTMLNALFGETVSIVSNKAHTTRKRIPTILTEENRQLVSNQILLSLKNCEIDFSIKNNCY